MDGWSKVLRESIKQRENRQSSARCAFITQQNGHTKGKHIICFITIDTIIHYGLQGKWDLSFDRPVRSTLDMRIRRWLMAPPSDQTSF